MIGGASVKIKYMPSSNEKPSDRLTIERVYTVLAFSISCSSRSEGVTSFDVRDDDGFLSSVRMNECYVIDGDPFKEWVIGRGNESSFVCWPQKFFDPEWIERLLEYDPEALRVFSDIADRADQQYQIT